MCVYYIGMDKIVENGMLYDFYGAMLTSHQQKVYEDAVYNDMSLTEIAQEEGISRQAVSDLLRRTTAQMRQYEERLGLIERFDKIRGNCDAITRAARSGDMAEVIRLTDGIRENL